MKEKLSINTIKAVATIICGNPIDQDKRISPYRTQNNLNEFFYEDLELKQPDGIMGTSRQSWTESWLKNYNKNINAKIIIEASVREGDYVNTDYNTTEVADYLNLFLYHDGLVLVKNGSKFKLTARNGVQLPETSNHEVLSEEYVLELSAKCEAKLADKDFDGAITNARTLIEAVLFSLEEKLTGKKTNHQGDLPKQYKHVSKLLNLDDQRSDLDDRFKDVIRGLTTIVHGLASIRNKMSDGHARELKPAAHHARVVVNSTKTIATFLVESYLFQKSKKEN